MKTRVLFAASAIALAACGGGGGASTPAAAPAPAATPSTAVQVDATTAQALAAHAMDNVQNTSGAQTSTAAFGVQVEPQNIGAVPTNAAIAGVLSMVAQATPVPLATAATVSRTVACSGGGTLSVTGSQAGAGLTTGDNVTITANSCYTPVNGTTELLTGSMSISIVGGAVPSTGTSFHVVVQLSLRDLIVATPTNAVGANGDMTLDLTQTDATTASMVATGSNLVSAVVTPAGNRSSGWTTYRQAISVSASTMASSLDGTILVKNSRMPINNGSYAIATLTPVQWTTSQGNPVAGVVKVVGKGNASVRVTFAASGVTIELDANGDGVYESAQTTTVAALKSQL